MIANQEFTVNVPTALGIMNYRVAAKNGDEAVFKVVMLHRNIGWPVQGEVTTLD